MLLRRGDAAEQAGDFALARTCFEQAAQLGEVIGLARLAYMFDAGLGGTPDKTEAMRHYRRAWRRGSAAAANNIAILYRERGDHRAMFRWFQRCAQAGAADAHLELAKCYVSGIGVRRSLDHALRSLAAVLIAVDVFEASREEAEAMMVRLRPRGV